ncbi:MAG: hypothetical protein JXB13_19830 [Phycisphaerae bacterium]|nr:hypothetical protein [Phycisphaerae bacterium]
MSDMLNQASLYCNAAESHPSSGGIEDHHAGCAKARTLTHDQVTSCIKKGLDLPEHVRRTLARHLASDRGLLVQRVNSQLDCALALAKHAMDDEGLRLPFLAFAQKLGSEHPDHAIRLLDDVVRVTDRARIELLDYLGGFVRTIGRPGNEEKFDEVHRKVDGWVAEEIENGNSENVVFMRNAQEAFVPHLLGYSRRLRHLAGSDHITARVRAKHKGEDLYIQGSVIDVSQGPPEVSGHGIQFMTPEWRFETGISKGTAQRGGRTLHLHTIQATRLGDGFVAEVDDPSVELKWPGGTLEDRALSLRGFAYDPKYNIPGGGAVLFLDGVCNDNMSLWQSYVTLHLSEVDYGRTGHAMQNPIRTGQTITKESHDEN